MKILYVEDHPAQSQVVAQTLQLSGHEVALAATGEEGIEKTYSWRPDVILMDLRMPGIGGIGAIQQLKSDPEVSDIPVIVISAWGDQKNQQQALEAGAIKVLTKPVGIEQLLEQINRAVSS